jgi:hypothetical protein
MDAKEYLMQIKNLEHKIYCMKLRSEEYDRMSLSIPGPSYGEKIGSNPNRNIDAPFVKWIYKKIEIDEKIKTLEEKLKNIKSQALLIIEELENEDFKTILVKRYIEGENWDVIASAIFVSKRTAIRWHDAALELLKLDDQDTQNN